MSITALVWIPIYWLRDMRGYEGAPFKFLTTMGYIPLTVYLFQPLVIQFMKLVGLTPLFKQASEIHFAVGFILTSALTLFICWVPIIVFRKKHFLLKV